MYLVLPLLAFSVQTWILLINFPPFYHGLGVLTLDRLTGELSVVRDLSPRAVMIDVATNNLSHAAIDSVSWVFMYGVPFVYARGHTLS